MFATYMGGVLIRFVIHVYKLLSLNYSDRIAICHKLMEEDKEEVVRVEDD